MVGRHRSSAPVETTLAVARVAAACGGGVVAAIAVDMPGGYLGVKDQITPAGSAYAAGMLVLGLYLMLGLRRGWAGTRRLEPLHYAVSAGLFLPAMVFDPVVAGIIVAWNVLLLAQAVLPRGPRLPARERFTDDAVGRWASRYGAALRHIGMVALALTVAVVGYRLSSHFLARLVCLSLHAASLALGSGLLLRLHRRGNRLPMAVFALLALAALSGALPALPLILLAIAEAVLLALLATGYKGTEDLMQGFLAHPSRLVIGSFASLVAVGALLLTFPAAAAAGHRITPVDALFTATSSSCVTGLIVVDTPTAFSPLGHLTLLALIQVGGLGIMVLSTFGTLLLGGTLGLRGEKALSEMLELGSAHHAYRLTRFIVLSTLAVEAVGASLLAVFFRREGLGWGEALWKGLFHSVSAFCNAGFALQSDSLELFRDNPLALMVVATLITFGGLGFIVLAGLWQWLRRSERGQLDTQIRAVLAMSVALVTLGTVLYLVLEWNGSLGTLAPGTKLANAFFQSVTLRTAGFNSVELGAALAPATALFMMAFMFIGASPGSTGGGIKTTTALVLLAAIRASAAGDRPVRLFDREIPSDVIRRSLAILVTSGVVLSAGFFALLVVERQPFLDLMFEAVSAFATVGLSLGATASLGPAGKLVLVVIMFLGRVGPLTLALVLGTGPRSGPRVRLPYSRLMVG